MDTEKTEILQGKKIEILEMALKQMDGQLVLSWKISFENTVFRMTFSNVSRFRNCQPFSKCLGERFRIRNS